MGKTYRKDVSERNKQKKNQKQIWKKIKNELKGVEYDYENEEEVSELSDDYLQADR